jgi:glycosyltransferase involved in cell wall biosynthesis
MAEVQLKYYKKVHYGVIFNISELEIINMSKNKKISKTAYMLTRIYKSLKLHLAYNRSLPSLKIIKYYLIWTKEIFISKGSYLDMALKLLKTPLKFIYILFYQRSELLNFFITSFIKSDYLELGKLNQHKPEKIKYEDFPEVGTDNYYTISLVTPSYNQVKFIERTIKSVLNQKYPKLEYCIQDGGSTDGTKKIVAKYKNKLTFFDSKKDKGQSNAINLGFKHTRGEIMAYLNSDDMLMPGSLFYVNKYFQENPDTDVIYGNRIIVDQNDKKIGRWVLYKHDNKVLKTVDYVPQETLFWRREIWEKIGGKVDESFSFAMDWDLLMRFMKANAKIVRVPYFLGMFRLHTDQKTSTQINTVGREECIKILKKYHKKVISENVINKISRDYVIKSSFTSWLLDRGFRI